MNPKRLTIALAGNPNSGKTTIFNSLTGTRQKVGNWPGVTVEKKEGVIKWRGREILVVDLPGTYSLTPFSIEEIVARDFVLDESPDVIIDIIDASNLERSLYLATQLREIDCRVVFALNMADVAKSRGIKIDVEKLSELLDVPVVFTVGNKNEGIDALLETALTIAESDKAGTCRRRVQYSKDIESAVQELMGVIEGCHSDAFPYNVRWTAVKLLEDDRIIRERLAQYLPAFADRIMDQARRLRIRLIDRFDEEPEILTTDERYGFISGIIKEVMTTSTLQRIDISRNIDLVLTNRLLGFPIFIFFIWAMFQLTFTLGEYPKGWIDAGMGFVSDMAGRALPEGLPKELIIDGILAGVGSVIVFLPNILILFFCISLFEDTGYMARAAFLMDKIMHMIGLHGKSFIPMIMGFGCNVPAIMATRTLESEKDRILTILITPLMSCSAKLPVYIVLTGTFFGPRAGSVIFGVYLLGIVLSIIAGRVFRSTLLKGADAPFVMELPPYRAPMLKNLMIHMWDRGKIFLRKMGGVILVGSVVIWTLATFPRLSPEMENVFESRRGQIEMDARDNGLSESQKMAALETVTMEEKAAAREHAFIGRIGKGLEPLFQPLGIDWRGGIALVTGFVAKEIVVSTLGVLHAVEDRQGGEALQRALRQSGMTPLSALSMMVFVLLYIPCIATVSAIRRETGSLKWTIFNISYSTLLAWTMAFCLYQGGKLFGFS